MSPTLGVSFGIELEVWQPGPELERAKSELATTGFQFDDSKPKGLEVFDARFALAAHAVILRAAQGRIMSLRDDVLEATAVEAQLDGPAKMALLPLAHEWHKRSSSLFTICLHLLI